MADELFDGVCLAIDEQSAFGTVNATVAALTGTIDETDGCVLGVKDAGDAESGVTIPNIEAVVREVAVVAGSWTEQADSFLRTAINNFSIAFPIQGNGATATPAAGEAKPFLGLDAIWESVGLDGANGTSPVYEYTPRATTIYTTAKLFVGDLSFVFQDCLVESTSIVFTPGGNGICTANFKVGSHDPATQFADGVTFPTVTYGTQSTLAAPTVEGVAFAAFGQTRGFENLTINITNTVEEYGDSNVDTTGLRQSQTRRVITVDGTIYVATADSDAAYQNLVSTSAPTADLSFQLGTAAGATDTINAAKFEVNNLQNKDIKYNRIGTALAVELSGAKATSTTAGTEFKLTFN
jgi:hypothetical protein